MNAECRKVQRVYLTLELLHTLAASFIWGAAIAALAIPFLWLARRDRTAADSISAEPTKRVSRN